MATELLAQLEALHKLPPGILGAVEQQESGGNSAAVSQKGAIGAFQIMPGTAAAYPGLDPKKREDAARIAAAELGRTSKKYKGDPTMMLAAYNAGQGNVDKYGGIPPFAETQKYVPDVTARMEGINPKDIQWDKSPQLDEKNIQWDEPTPAAQPQQPLQAAAPVQQAPVAQEPLSSAPPETKEHLAERQKQLLLAQLKPGFSERFAEGGINALKNMAAGGSQMLWDLYGNTVGRAIPSQAKLAQEQIAALSEGAKNQPQGVPEMLGGVVNSALLPGPSLAAGTMAGRAGMGMLAGTAYGGLTPAETPEERLKNMGVGAAVGGLVSPAIETVGKVAAGVKNPAAQALRDQGITPTTGQILGGAWKRAEEKARSVVLLGDAITAGQRRPIREFNKAVYADVLEPISGKVPQEVGRDSIENIRKQISDNYENLLPQLTFKADRTSNQDISDIAAKLSGTPEDIQKAYLDFVTQNIAKPMQEGKPHISMQNGQWTQSPTATISGEDFKTIENALTSKAKAGKNATGFERDLADAYKETLVSLRQGLMRSNPKHAQELFNQNEAWARYSRLRDAGNKVTGSQGDFVFTPGQFQQAVRSQAGQVSKGNFSGGKAKMQGLSDPAVATLSQNYPDSGTAGRNMLTNAIAGGGVMMDPTGVLATGAAMAGMYTPQGQRAMAKLLMDRPELAKQLGAVLSGASGNIGAGVAAVQSQGQ